MHRKRTAILSHILLVVLCILIRLPGEKEVQQPYTVREEAGVPGSAAEAPRGDSGKENGMVPFLTSQDIPF